MFFLYVNIVTCGAPRLMACCDQITTRRQLRGKGQREFVMSVRSRYSGCVATDDQSIINCQRDAALSIQCPWLKRPPSDPDHTEDILIVSDIRLVRETLAMMLMQAFDGARIRGATNLAEVQTHLEVAVPTLVLIDATIKDGLLAARFLKQYEHVVSVITFGVNDAVDDVAAWRQEGSAACLSHTLSLRDAIDMIGSVMSRQSADRRRHSARTPRKTASSADRATDDRITATAVLTAREEDVVRLIMSGESNKGIARHLNISVATVKTHVHNLLAKLGLERRGKLAPWHKDRQRTTPAGLPSALTASPTPVHSVERPVQHQ